MTSVRITTKVVLPYSGKSCYTLGSLVLEPKVLWANLSEKGGYYEAQSVELDRSYPSPDGG